MEQNDVTVTLCIRPKILFRCANYYCFVAANA